jgi:PPOX class probable F420-dependent enzyme
MNEIETVASFDNLAHAKSLLLTTYKRDGTPVPTPVCHVVENGMAYLTTMEGAGKVKRIRNDPRVTVGHCDMRGNPTGPSYAATARIVAEQEVRKAKKLKHSRLIGTVFATSARAHWAVKPMQLYERLWHRQHFVGIAIEPLLTSDQTREAA